MKKILSSQITPHSIYLNRRKFIKNASALSIASSLSLPVEALHSGDLSEYHEYLDKEDIWGSFYRDNPSAESALFYVRYLFWRLWIPLKVILNMRDIKKLA